jgi:putative SOS response-associated peptidase YedK
MCGRYALIDLAQAMKEAGLHIKIGPKSLLPQYNIAPSQLIPVVLNTTPDELTMARWGLIPAWAKDMKSSYKMINARAETIVEKPTFKRLFRKQRCLILADGFYEWRQGPSPKTPFRITLKEGGPFAFAGLWDAWENPETKSTLISSTIITTTANSLLKEIHDRMPVILRLGEAKPWLAPDLSEAKALAMLKPFPASAMRTDEISLLVNSPGNNVPDVWQPVGRPVLRRK